MSNDSIHAEISKARAEVDSWPADIRDGAQRTTVLQMPRIACNTKPEDFFQTLVGCAPETAATLCDAQMRRWVEEREELNRQRSSLPRNDKKGAGELLQQMQRLEVYIRRVRRMRGVYRNDADRKETNALWSDAVRAVCGSERLAAVRAWIRAERERLSAIRGS